MKNTVTIKYITDLGEIAKTVLDNASERKINETVKDITELWGFKILLIVVKEK